MTEDEMYDIICGYEESEREYHERNNELENESAKLREYAESYAKAVEGGGCGWCPMDLAYECGTETIPMHEGCKLYDELRELGIEVWS